MTRDFTQAEKDKLLGYVQQDHDKNENRGWWGGIVDWAADGINYGGLDIADYTNNLDTYHKKLIDKEDFSSQDIENLFEAVGNVDGSYSTSASTSDGLLQSYKQTLIDLKSLVSTNSGYPENTKMFLETEEFFGELNEVGEGVVDYYYLQYLTDNGDGTYDVNWDAVSAFFKRDVEDISPAEYAAMIKLTDSFVVEQDGVLTLDTESMERFMECAYLHGDVEEFYYEGEWAYSGKTATLSPVFTQLDKCMQVRTNVLIDALGDYLYDDVVGDNLEQFLEADAMKTCIFAGCSSNLDRLVVSVVTPDEEQRAWVRDWKVEINLGDVYDVDGEHSHYTLSIPEEVTIYNERGKHEIEVYGFTNTFNGVTHENITEIATSLYVDIDKKLIDDTTKEIVNVALDYTVGLIADKVPVVDGVYTLGGYLFEESQAIAEAQALNNATGNIVASVDIGYYSDALNIGGCVNSFDGQLQVVVQYCNEDLLLEKIQFYNNNNSTNVDMEQLIADYNSMLEGNGPSQALQSFSDYISKEYH